MDNQVNNTFNPVGLVGGVKKEGISEENTNKMLGILTENNEILKKIEDSIIALSESLNKKVETIDLESVMPTPVNTSEEQVEQPIVAPAESIEENDLNKTEDLSDLSAQLENVNVMSEPQTAENVTETNTIDLSTPVEVPNPIKDEVTPDIEGAVELANSEVNEPAVETTLEEDNIIPINLEELAKEDTEPNFVQPEVSQIEEQPNNVVQFTAPQAAPVQEAAPVVTEQPQLVEPVAAVPTQEPVQAVQPSNVVQFPATQAAPVQEAAPVVTEQPQLVEPVVAAPAQEPVQVVQPNNVVQFPAPQTAPVQEAAPVVTEQPQLVEPVAAVPTQEPVQAVQPNNVVQFPAPQTALVQEAAPVAEPENNVEKVTGVVIQAAFGEGKQRSEVVSQEQQENLKKEVVSKTLTNTMSSMANAA